MSGIRGMFSGQGNAQTRAQDLFIKDFMQDAITSVNNGIDGGLINTDAKPGAPTKATTPTTPTTPAQPQGSQPEKPQTQYMGKIAPNAGPATKPKAPVNPFQAPTVPKTTVSTKPSSASTPGGITKGGATFTKESKFEKLNAVFESIINVNEAEQMSLSVYLMSWYKQYMQGAQWEGSKPLVQSKIDKLAKEYPNNYKNNLKELARLSLALSKAGTPAGAPAEFTSIQQASSKSLEQGMQEIQQFLGQLAKADPATYNKFIKSLQPVAVPGASAGVVAEGKRKKK